MNARGRYWLEHSERAGRLFGSDVRAHDWLSGRPFLGNQAFLAGLLSGSERMRILDVGCGNGLLTKPLSSRHLVYGVDFSSSMVRLAIGNRAHAACSLAEQLPFPDASFDAVLCIETLQCIDDGLEALRQMARVLRPGGLFVLQTLNRASLVRQVYRLKTRDREPLRMFTVKELTAQARACGLGVRQIFLNFYPLSRVREWRGLRSTLALVMATSLVLVAEPVTDAR
jgi:ubiquinone/menaquinone biosynthesis C-methylase UbiE